MTINPIQLRGGQSVCDDILTSLNQCCRRRMLPRGLGLSSISRDVIRLASRFEFIIYS